VPTKEILLYCTCNVGWRYAELDRAVKEKDCCIKKLRDAAEERELRLHAEVRSLTTKLEQSAVRIRELEWTAQDLQKDKASVIERYTVVAFEMTR